MTRQHLSARERQRCFDAAKGRCDICGFPIVDGEGFDISHRIPLAAGGEDVPANRFPAHRKCHARQTAEIDAERIAKTRRQRQKASGARPRSARPIAGSKASGWRKRMDGTAERRT